MKVFRTGLLDAADASDIGVADGAAATAARRRGDGGARGARERGSSLGAPVRSVERDGASSSTAAREDVDAVDRRGAARGRGQDRPGRRRRRARARALGASPIVNLHVHYDRRVLDEPFAAAARHRRCSGSSTARSRRASRGDSSSSVSLSGAATEIGEPSPTLRERYLPALERLLPAAPRRDVLDFTVTREPRATFRAAPGQRRLRPGTRTRVPGLYLAGAWTDTGWPATMESAVRSGHAAAAAAARRPRRTEGTTGGRGVTVTASPRVDAARARRSRAAATHLLSLQHPDGWWKGELETNVTIDAEDLFVRHFLGILTEPQRNATARWIRSKQREDGTWATFFGGPGDLSTTVEAYVALRLVGDPPDAAHMRDAAAFVRDGGGVERTRVFTRMWLSLLSLHSWDDVPVLPPEQILLPARAPLSVYSFGCWARQTLVALSIASALRPSARVPFGIDELRTRAPRRREPTDAWGRAFTQLDRGLHRYERRPVAPLRRRALRAAERWIVERQERRRLVGRHPAAVGLVDRRAARARLPTRPSGASSARSRASTASPSRTRQVAGSRRASRRSGTRRSRCSRCSTPGSSRVTTPSRAERAGSPAARSVCAETGRCDARNSSRAGSRSSSRTTTTPTSTTPPSSCSRCGAPAATTEAPPIAGLAWALGMQSSDGGWGAFDADNTSGLCREAAVLRLRRGHRSAERRRDRAHGRAARRTRASRTHRRRARGVE